MRCHRVTAMCCPQCYTPEKLYEFDEVVEKAERVELNMYSSALLEF